MTGEELWRISPFDYNHNDDSIRNKWSILICTKDILLNKQDTTYFAKKDEILYVEYRNRFNDGVYVRNITTKNVACLSPGWFLGNLELYRGDAPIKHNNSVLKLPFISNNKVWFIYNNEIHEGVITNYTVSGCTADDAQISYDVLYKTKTVKGEAYANGVPSSRLFSTKEELIENL